jgi:ankyrin repeat protein
LASSRGYVEVAKILLEQGANMAATSNNGWTPLNSASRNRHLKVVKMLLEQGANIIATSNDR